MTSSGIKLRALAAIPPVFALVFALAGMVGGAGSLSAVLGAENEAGKVLAVVGCFTAALAFEGGDYLRRAWLYSGLCYVLLLASDLAGMPWAAPLLPRHGVDVAQGALTVVANAASVAGTWMLARAWTVAGLDDEDDAVRSRGRLLFGGAIVASLAVTGWSFIHDVLALLAGNVGASVSIASDVGDTICLALVAPLLQTALALRGGVLRWPWGLLTASGVAWIAFDAASDLVAATEVHAAKWLIVTEALRALGCGLFFAAGLAQRLVVAPGTGQEAHTDN